MRAAIIRIWRAMNTSFWFVPALMGTGAVVLSVLLEAIDARFAAESRNWPDWLVVHEAENARVLLSTIASSMLTVAGVTFSIVVLALSLASQQFGPRLLVNFMRDTGNQVVLGTFVSIYLHCVLVLRQIDGEGVRDIPQLSLAAAVVMSVGSLGVLVYFFHHVSVSILAEEVVAEAGKLLEQAVCHHFPAKEDEEGDEEGRDEGSGGWPEDFDDRHRPVPSRGTGYLDVIDFDALLALAREHDLALFIELREGEFIAEGDLLARAYPEDELDDDLVRKIAESFNLARLRGTTEAVQLAVDRVTEIGVRAMSPSINDPYTAIACIDRLGAGFALLAERGKPVTLCRDGDGRTRIRLRAPSRAGLVDAAWQQLRLYGRENVRVLERLLDALRLVAARLDDSELRDAVKRQGEMVRDTARESLRHDWERDQVERAYDSLRDLLEP